MPLTKLRQQGGTLLRSKAVAVYPDGDSTDTGVVLCYQLRALDLSARNSNPHCFGAIVKRPGKG